eukprot:scaffold76268_cov75-Phaeocystis_antarctica.AAC.4
MPGRKGAGSRHLSEATAEVACRSGHFSPHQHRHVHLQCSSSAGCLAAAAIQTHDGSTNRPARAT